MSSLPAQLEAASLRVLARTWHEVNRDRFRGAMVAPALELSEVTARLGRWVAASRTLELQRALVLDGSWGQVVEVLKHEMAHQYVWEILGERDETPHGPRFREICGRLGIDAAAAGVPEAPGGDAAPDRIVERVGKLLALAGSSNEHEARAAMAAAQRLMLKHNLETARAAGARPYRVRHLGTPSARVPEHEKLLAGLLGAHFFVECLWIPVWRAREGKRGSVLEVCGTPENVDLAAHVHAFLLASAERAWREFKRARRAPDRERRAFQAGVVSGFGETLAKQAERHREEALVWAGDAGLRAFHKRRHPWTRSSSYTRSPGAEARAAGRDQGRRVVLHRPVSPGGGGSQGGSRLLGGGG